MLPQAKPGMPVQYTLYAEFSVEPEEFSRGKVSDAQFCCAVRHTGWPMACLSNLVHWRWLLSKIFFGTVAVCLTGLAYGQGTRDTSASLEFSSLIQRLEQTQRNARIQTPYQLVRQYRLFANKSPQASSNVVVEIQYLPPDRETYAIQAHTGSSRGEQVVRRILDHESALAAGNPESRSAALLTGDNYSFTNLGESTLEGKSFYLIGLTPKRRQKELVVGRAWIDKHTFSIRRIEGHLAKSPSWLLKDVYVKLDFSQVSSLWVQTRMEATAEVRFVGSQTLQAETLDYRTTGVVATANPPSARAVRRGIPAELLFPSGK